MFLFVFGNLCGGIGASILCASAVCVYGAGVWAFGACVGKAVRSYSEQEKDGWKGAGGIRQSGHDRQRVE